MKILKVGKMLTVILSDNSQLINTNVSDELFTEIKQCIAHGDENCVKQKMAPELCKEEIQIVAKQQLSTNVDILVDSGLFERRNDAVYRTGISISMPESLVLEFTNLIQSKGMLTGFEEMAEFRKLDNFWMWCSLNPNAESREDLFRFLAKHQMAITNDGMVLAYRRVVSKKTKKSDIVTFVSNQYIKVKTIWKKKPSNYFVITEDDMTLTLDTSNKEDGIRRIEGNLEDLYLNLPKDEEQFTDNHTHTFDYRIGQETRMERSDCNQSNRVSCSSGIHVASKAYNYGSFGDTPILVAFNPMDVVSVPQGEDGKMRVCAMTPIAVLSEEEDRVLLDKDVDISEITTQHYQQQVGKLKELVSENTPYELGINNILSNLGQSSVDTIIKKLDMNKVISNRVIDSFIS